MCVCVCVRAHAYAGTCLCVCASVVRPTFSPRGTRAIPTPYTGHNPVTPYLFPSSHDAVPAPGANVPPDGFVGEFGARVEVRGVKHQKDHQEPPACREELGRLRCAALVAASRVHHGVSCVALRAKRPLARVSTLCFDSWPSVTVLVLTLAFIDYSGVTVEAEVPEIGDLASMKC